MTGNVDLGNNGRGVYIGSGSNNVIGDVNGNGNLISGNSVGIQVDSSSNVQVVNNLVGVNAAGTGALGNQQQGILVQNSSRRHRPAELGVCQWRQRHRAERLGQRRVSAPQHHRHAERKRDSAQEYGSRPPDLQFLEQYDRFRDGRSRRQRHLGKWRQRHRRGRVGYRQSIRRNSLLGNTLRGIDLANNGVTANDVGDADTGANHLQNFPVLATAPGGIQGTLNSRPSLTYTVEDFINENCDPSGNGKGRAWSDRCLSPRMPTATRHSHSSLSARLS